MLPRLSASAPSGRFRRACSAGPSVSPGCAGGEPASVVTCPSSETARTRLLPASVNASLPARGSNAIAFGKASRAAGPTPSSRPGCPAAPANVLTTPARVILRIVWFSESATYACPRRSTVMPFGPLNRAVEVPSLLPVWNGTQKRASSRPSGANLDTTLAKGCAAWRLPATSTAKLNCPGPLERSASSGKRATTVTAPDREILPDRCLLAHVDVAARRHLHMDWLGQQIEGGAEDTRARAAAAAGREGAEERGWRTTWSPARSTQSLSYVGPPKPAK